jgi:tetratricopeptide (TPR) repeat protein
LRLPRLGWVSNCQAGFSSRQTGWCASIPALRRPTRGWRHALAFVSRGQARNDTKQYDRAIADYSQAILRDPKNKHAFAGRAFAYASQNDYDRAILDYDEAIRLDPANPVPLRNRGLLFKWKGEIERANADFEQAKRLGR